jgi:cytochrome c peroxidase
MLSLWFLAATACLPFALTGCRGRSSESPVNKAPTSALVQADPLAALGRELFFDPSLSASGRIACASCHDPRNAYAPSNSLPLQAGGPFVNRAIFRAVPSLSYVLGHTPNWHQERASSFVERLEDRDNPPFGGFGWDGRFKTLGEQAAFPLLSPQEMANPSPQVILDKLKHAPYAARLRQIFGPDVLTNPNQALVAVGRALEMFELTDPSFRPFSSKFDAVLDGHATLTTAEQHGLELFNDPQRGNCNSCHTSAVGADGSHPLFTNFQFEALGVPRNSELPANQDRHFYDLGLCGPLRTDQSSVSLYCGLFKTPTLRNVATRGAFFHNARFHTLRQALEFYVQRDTNPERFYPSRANGTPDKFNDLPVIYRGNVDTVDNPLTKHHGDAPAWSPSDIDDVLAFLNTLTDGYLTTPSAHSPSPPQK